MWENKSVADVKQTEGKGLPGTDGHGATLPTCQHRHGRGLPSTVVAQEDCYLSFIEVQGQVSDAHLVLITHLEHL